MTGRPSSRFAPEPYAHRLAGVDEQPEREVGFLFVLLEIKLAGAAIDLPVKMLEIITRDIFAVLSELDGKAVIGAFVHAREVAFDDEPSLKLEASHLGKRHRVEILLRAFGHGKLISGEWSWRTDPYYAFMLIRAN